MKIRFIDAKYIGKYADMNDIIESSKILPKNIFLGSSVQFLDKLDDIKKTLEKIGKSVIIITGNHSSKKGQILGCDIYSSKIIIDEMKKSNSNQHKNLIEFNMKDSCFLIISTGEFHALSSVLAEIGKKEPINTYSLNPIDGKIKKLENKFSIKGLYLKFLESNNIGILITTKPGQNDEKNIQKIIDKFPGKNFYKIIADNINPQSLEDFNYIQFYINTACPRMIDEKDNFTKQIINISNLLDAIEIYSKD